MIMLLPVFFRTDSKMLRKGTDKIGTVLITDGSADCCDFLLGGFKLASGLIKPEGLYVTVQVHACFFLEDTGQIIRMKIIDLCKCFQAQILLIVC